MLAAAKSSQRLAWAEPATGALLAVENRHGERRAGTFPRLRGKCPQREGSASPGTTLQ